MREMTFDFQWKKLSDPALGLNETRINEFLAFTALPRTFFRNKRCLDAGCGSGRWTWVMQKLGANVDSFDISEEAVARCREINPSAYISDLRRLERNPSYDFVLCWGVLHHLKDPEEGFRRIAGLVKPGGTLHIMVYHRDTQLQYERLRLLWRLVPSSELRLLLCRIMARTYRQRIRRLFEKVLGVKPGGTVHGWWDALSPRYNWSFSPQEIERWFKDEGFTEIELTQKYHINMRGRRVTGT